MNLKRNILKRRIAPGIWEDMDGNAHFALPELLALVDLPDTPENRASVTAMLREVLAQNCPDATVIEREKPDEIPRG